MFGFTFRPSEKEIILDRALSRLGDIGYNILWKNCEHFASWCRYGEEWSEQVRTLETNSAEKAG